MLTSLLFLVAAGSGAWSLDAVVRRRGILRNRTL